MSKTCLKCNKTFEESEVENPTSQKYHPALTVGKNGLPMQ